MALDQAELDLQDIRLLCAALVSCIVVSCYSLMPVLSCPELSSMHTIPVLILSNYTNDRIMRGNMKTFNAIAASKWGYVDFSDCIWDALKKMI